MQDNTDKPDYKGLRALMLLRVSTPKQEEMFGWPSQEKEIREKLIDPLGLKLDEARGIIRDTYTGLEFRERPALTRILEMAKRGEFDVLCMDVLDRLGREGIPREVYRAQVRELGVCILTTKPEEHADDDTSIGELIRILHGFKAKEELLDIKRRTMHGKRAKVEGRQKDGTIGPKKIIGSGNRLYGYQYILDEKGKRMGYELNLAVILVDEDGIEWTEIKVVLYIFESAASGISYGEIARYLNDKGIPPPNVAKGVQLKQYKGKPVWQRAVISRMIQQSGYYGELPQFKTRRLPKVSGGRKDPRRKTTEKEQIIVPIPPIVTKEIALAARKHATRNQKLASRNNAYPQESLLRAGLVKCGHCGGNMSFRRNFRRTTNELGYYPYYVCTTHASLLERCASGCSIPATAVDEAAWEEAVKIIRDPSEVDNKVRMHRSPDPTEGSRKNILAKLKKIRDEQEALQDYLAERIKKRKLDPKTEDHLTTQLQQLGERELKWMEELAKDVDIHEQWKQLQAKLDELHAVCADMREKLDDPEYIPPYEKKRELCEFFGITVVCYRSGHKPPYEVEVNSPSIVSPLSWME